MKYLFGNWKMSANKQVLKQFFDDLSKTKKQKQVVCGIAVPSVYLDDVFKTFKKFDIKTGAQNVSYAQSGAFTGEISATMLLEKNVDFCLVGHSERRTLFFETDQDVNKKIEILLSQNITPVLCIGETLEQYQNKQTKKVLQKQLKLGLKNIQDVNKIIVAYEPVWAIGTGKSATQDDIKSSIDYIKQTLGKMYPNNKSKVPVLYGGSVKPENAKQIFELECVDGVLVGGASLDCKKFFEIAKYV